MIARPRWLVAALHRLTFGRLGPCPRCGSWEWRSRAMRRRWPHRHNRAWLEQMFNRYERRVEECEAALAEYHRAAPWGSGERAGKILARWW